MSSNEFLKSIREILSELDFEIRKGFVNELSEYEGTIIPLLKLRPSVLKEYKE